MEDLIKIFTDKEEEQTTEIGLLETRLLETSKLTESVDFRAEWSNKLEDFHPREVHALAGEAKLLIGE